MTNKLLLFLLALIPLLMSAPSLSYASVTPELHKCIHDKMVKLLAAITIGMALDRSPEMIATIDNGVDNYTTSIEECLK
jgi:hypothetical protein